MTSKRCLGLNIVFGGYNLRIGQRLINGNEGAFIIAEIAQAHDGSLGLAHSYIDAVADVGADAVKFQTHIASAESTKNEKFRVPMSGQDNSRFDYWKRMEFTKKQWRDLSMHANERGLVFLSSPFSVDACELLSSIGLSAWKIGSGEVYNHQLINEIIKTKKPILLSTGMSPFSDIDEIYKKLKANTSDFAFFQCTSSYPSPLDQVGLNIIEEFRNRYECHLGLSDHSGTVFPSLAAMSAHAIDLIEVHVVFDKRMYGPDTSSSITIEDLSFLVAANKAFTTMRNYPVDKNLAAQKLEETKQLFTKSLCLINSLEAGELIDVNNLTLKKPGTGIPYSQLDKVVGRRVSNKVLSDRLINWDDLEK